MFARFRRAQRLTFTGQKSPTIGPFAYNQVKGTMTMTKNRSLVHKLGAVAARIWFAWLLPVLLVGCLDDRNPNEISHPTPANLPPKGSPVIRSVGLPQGLADEALDAWTGIRQALLADHQAVVSVGRLGLTTDGGPDVFGMKIDLETDNGENILVLDQDNHKVKIFSRNGEYLGGLGRAGPGPGEFLAPTAIERMTDGSILVADRGNRVNVYSPSDTGYIFTQTHDVPVVPESACSAENRFFVSGWTPQNNTVVHEIAASKTSVSQSFGKGYQADYWLVQDQLSDGPIACLADPLRVVFAFERIPVVQAYAPDDQSLLWSAVIEDYLQPPIVERRKPGGRASVYFSSEGARDMVMSLTPVFGRYILLQTARIEPAPDVGDVSLSLDDGRMNIRSYLVDAQTGQSAFISDALPVIATAGSKHHLAVWILPFPRFEVRSLAARGEPQNRDKSREARGANGGESE